MNQHFPRAVTLIHRWWWSSSTLYELLRIEKQWSCCATLNKRLQYDDLGLLVNGSGTAIAGCIHVSSAARDLRILFQFSSFGYVGTLNMEPTVLWTISSTEYYLVAGVARLYLGNLSSMATQGRVHSTDTTGTWFLSSLPILPHILIYISISLKQTIFADTPE